jgi:phage baseplate assembly protein W
MSGSQVPMPTPASVTTPHFDLPFRFGGYVEQGSVRDLANCVYMIVSTPLGYREEVPNFGTPNLSFETPPVIKESVKTSIMDQEPRAEMLFSETFGLSELDRVVHIALEQRRSAGN